MIGPEIAVPLGLLVTEAITNAYKHAFNERSGGHIYVDVRRPSPETLELAVRDDGSGFDPAAGEDGTGLGRSLIEAFVRQLRGELEITGDAGTSLVVRFPAPARNPAARARRPQRARLPAVGHEPQAAAAPRVGTPSRADEPMTRRRLANWVYIQ